MRWHVLVRSCIVVVAGLLLLTSTVTYRLVLNSHLAILRSGCHRTTLTDAGVGRTDLLTLLDCGKTAASGFVAHC